MVYFDNNATTRVLPQVLEAMLPFFSDDYFNPSSAAGALQNSGRALREARERVARLINCSPEEIILTSGATESNNWVIKSAAWHAVQATGKCHIVVSAIEHPSVLEVVGYLAENFPGVKVDHAPVTTDGVLDISAFEDLLRADTAVVSVMLANNETGVIQPVADAAAIARRICPGCVFHTDATQAVTRIEMSLQTDLKEVDCLSLSSHKFHGPKGIGALFIRNGVSLPPLLHGGGQQGAARAGTENPALAAGLAKAAEMALATRDSNHLEKLRDLLESSLSDLGVTILGAGAPRLPNTSLILFRDIEAEMLIHQLLEAGFVTSTGSACSSGSDRPSHVTLAMGVDYGSAMGALRISLSEENTKEDISRFAEFVRTLLTHTP